MKKLSRYILKNFIAMYSIGLLTVVSIYLIVNFFEQLDRFIDQRVSLGIIAKYYLYQIPYLINLFSPMAVLLGSFISISEMIRNREIIAIKASGINVVKSMWIVFAFCLILTITTIVFWDLVQVKTTSVAKEIREKEIDRTRENGIVVAKFTFFDEKGWIYHFDMLNVKEKRAYNIYAFKIEGDNIKKIVFAENGYFRDSLWVLENPHTRVLNYPRDSVTSYLGEVGFTELNESPFSMIEKSRRLDELRISELMELIKKLKRTGLPSNRELIELNIRFSFPTANLVVLFFSIGLSLITGHRGRAYAFGIAIFLAFFYWGLLQAARILAGAGKFNPFISAWFPNFLLILLTLPIFSKIKT